MEVKLTDALIAALPQPGGDVVRGGRVVEPVAGMHAGPVGAQHRDEPLRVQAVQPEGAVVGCTGDEGPQDMGGVQLGPDGGRIVYGPGGAAVVNMGVEDGQWLRGSGRAR